jgi:exopolyphosphatase/pppGpp-phosphohydrolase
MIAERYQAPEITAFGTEVFRKAQNASYALETIKART